MFPVPGTGCSEWSALEARPSSVRFSNGGGQGQRGCRRLSEGPAGLGNSKLLGRDTGKGRREGTRIRRQAEAEAGNICFVLNWLS